MKRVTVSLLLVVGFGAFAATLPPGPVCAAPDQAEDPVAEWNSRWDKAFKDAAKEYEKLAKKWEQKLEATSAFTRWKVLRYAPDDPETRAYLGYVKGEKGADGKESWQRNDIVHDKLKEMADLADPKATTYSKDLGEADRKVATWFKGLALKATENGAAKGASADAKWAEKAQRAWEQVLDVEDAGSTRDPANTAAIAKLAEDAHKALGHPQFDKKYVTPFKLQFLKTRGERKALGLKEHDTAIKPCDPCEPDGKFVAAGLAGGGAKSTNMTINATGGKDLALRLAAGCERSLMDLIAIYGYPDTVKERLAPKKLSVVKDPEEYRKFLTKGAGWNDARVQKFLDAGFRNVGLDTEFLLTSSGGADADDSAINITAVQATHAAQGAARSDVGGAGKEVREGVEDWLWQSISYDVTKRVNGTALLVWGTFGKYGDAIEGRPGEDKWVELARRMVQTDDDVALSRLPKLKIANQDFKGPQTIKGWAFIQFLFEKDPEKAKTFIWQALANGTPAAALAVYPNEDGTPEAEKSMDKLDEEYRHWILKGW